jgi:hypothetical protein
MADAVPLPKILARTTLEKDLGELLDHLAEWGYENELEIASLQGEWVVCLTPLPDDPRTDRFLAYISERPAVWRIGASAVEGGQPNVAPEAGSVQVLPPAHLVMPVVPPVH